jgi:hypothetical protein
MLVTTISLLVTALLVLLALTTMFKSSNGSTKLSNQPGVGLADDLQAQQSLQTTLTASSALVAGAGGYGGVTAASLSESNPSITYVSGPSSSADTVSVATSDATADSGSGIGGDGSDQNSGGSGSMTLAAWSSSGNCWLIWTGGGATWFGEQTGLTSCVAPALASPPVAGTPSSTAIGWRLGAFPSNA